MTDDDDDDCCIDLENAECTPWHSRGGNKYAGSAAAAESSVSYGKGHDESWQELDGRIGAGKLEVIKSDLSLRFRKTCDDFFNLWKSFAG